MEVVDECIGKLGSAAADAGATMIVTADHGNLDMMWEVDKRSGDVKQDSNGNPVAKTSHTLSPVPWLLTGAGDDHYRVNPGIETPGLGNLAATLLLLLGYEKPEDYLPSLLLPV
jgi:2,3-bisphosphoglycerate-independent phosphoglycerate mutase